MYNALYEYYACGIGVCLSSTCRRQLRTFLLTFSRSPHCRMVKVVFAVYYLIYCLFLCLSAALKLQSRAGLLGPRTCICNSDLFSSILLLPSLLRNTVM